MGHIERCEPTVIHMFAAPEKVIVNVRSEDPQVREPLAVVEYVPADAYQGAVGALRAQAAEMRGRVEPASWKTYEAVEVADMLDSFADRFGGR